MGNRPAEGGAEKPELQSGGSSTARQAALEGNGQEEEGGQIWHVVRVPPSTLQPAELHLRKGPGTTSPTQRADKAVTVGLVPDTLNPRTKQLADQLRRSGSANQATDGQDSSCVKSLITREPEGSGPK